MSIVTVVVLAAWCFVVSWIAVRHYAVVRARREAAGFRSELDSLRDACERLRAQLAAKGEPEWQDAEVVLLEGRLVVDSDGVVPPEPQRRELGPAKIAAISHVLSPSRFGPTRAEPHPAERAESLALETALGRVVLDGPIAVVAGSRRFSRGNVAARTAADRSALSYAPSSEHHGAPSDVEWFEFTSVLDHGDPVVALGLQRARDGGAYRDRPDARLSSAPSVSGIRLAATSALRVSVHPLALVRSSAVVAVILLPLAVIVFSLIR